MRLTRTFAAVLMSCAFALPNVFPANAQETVRIEPVVTDLDTPWAIAPLPDGRVLITLKEGKLLLAGADGRTEISGVPQVDDGGQGGLLDITLARGRAAFWQPRG